MAKTKGGASTPSIKVEKPYVHDNSDDHEEIRELVAILGRKWDPAEQVHKYEVQWLDGEVCVNVDENSGLRVLLALEWRVRRHAVAASPSTKTRLKNCLRHCSFLQRGWAAMSEFVGTTILEYLEVRSKLLNVAFVDRCKRLMDVFEVSAKVERPPVAGWLSRLRVHCRRTTRAGHEEPGPASRRRASFRRPYPLSIASTPPFNTRYSLCSNCVLQEAFTKGAVRGEKLPKGWDVKKQGPATTSTFRCADAAQATSCCDDGMWWGRGTISPNVRAAG